MEGCLKANQKMIEKGNLIGDQFFLEENQKKPFEIIFIKKKIKKLNFVILFKT